MSLTLAARSPRGLRRRRCRCGRKLNGCGGLIRSQHESSSTVGGDFMLVLDDLSWFIASSFASGTGRPDSSTTTMVTRALRVSSIFGHVASAVTSSVPGNPSHPGGRSRQRRRTHGPCRLSCTPNTRRDIGGRGARAQLLAVLIDRGEAHSHIPQPLAVLPIHHLALKANGLGQIQHERGFLPRSHHLPPLGLVRLIGGRRSGDLVFVRPDVEGETAARIRRPFPSRGRHPDAEAAFGLPPAGDSTGWIRMGIPASPVVLPAATTLPQTITG